MIRLEETPHENYKNFLVLSLLGNILFASLASYGLWQWESQRSQLSELSDSYGELLDSYTELSAQCTNLEQQLNLTKTQLDYYKEQAEFYSNLLESGNATIGIIGQATVRIVAVGTVREGLRTKYQGVVMGADVELREGNGRILVDTVPRIGIDIQTSARTAVRVVEDMTGISFGKTNVVLTIKASQDVEIVDGSSAGAAITVAILAAIRRQGLNENVYMTGTINSDGSIGQVGGIPEKALAAAENGSEYFLVPKGQSTVIVSVPKVSHPFPGWTVITYEKKLVDLQDYLEEEGYSTAVVEVETIEEAYAEFSSI